MHLAQAPWCGCGGAARYRGDALLEPGSAPPPPACGADAVGRELPAIVAGVGGEGGRGACDISETVQLALQ